MKVFISHSHKDDKIVKKLATGLKDQNVDVWLDKWEIQPGDLIIYKIEEALRECQDFLIILSSESVKSPFVEHEWHIWMMRQFELEKQSHAKNQKTRRRIIPIIFGQVEIPFFLTPYKYLKIDENDYQSAVTKLVELFNKRRQLPSDESTSIVSKRILASYMKDLVPNQFEEVVKRLDTGRFVGQPQTGVPEDISRLPRIKTLLDLIEQRSTNGWIQLEETILFARSPLYFPEHNGLSSWIGTGSVQWDGRNHAAF